MNRLTAARELGVPAAAVSPARPMRWPDAVAYREAVGQPRLVFELPELSRAQVMVNKQQLPLSYSGRFATVFRLKTTTGDTNGDWALRCFTTPDRDHQRGTRYAALAARWAQYAALDVLPSALLPFQYEARGILVGGLWYPIVRMPWAGGVPLGQFVLKNHARPPVLRELAAALGETLADLENAGVVHGDWQHDNILVSDNGQTVTLVDYDGLRMANLPAPSDSERGHPNYQHPSDGAILSDRFSCLAIQTALLAVAADSAL